MFKIVLVIVLFSLCSLIGYIYGEKFRRRFENLKEINKNIILLQNEVIYNNTPIPEALLCVGEKTKEPFNNILFQVSNYLKDGLENDVYLAFSKAYKMVEDEVYLLRGDISILGDFLRSLGESGVYGQEKIFKLVLENLKINIEESEQISKRNTKLYRYLGVCFGAMISIFLL